MDNSTSRRPFVIKIHADGVNAVSGGSSTEDTATVLRCKLLLAEGEFIQNYAAAGSQLWLDGIASRDSKVMQFVVMHVGIKLAAPRADVFNVPLRDNITTAGTAFMQPPHYAASSRLISRLMYLVAEDIQLAVDISKLGSSQASVEIERLRIENKSLETRTLCRDNIRWWNQHFDFECEFSTSAVEFCTIGVGLAAG